MVEFRSILFVLSFFFLLYFLLLPQIFLHLPFFLLSSFFFLLFLLSPSILVLSLLELFKQVPTLVGAHSGRSISFISDEICSHKCLFNFSLDPRLSSRLGLISRLAFGSLDFDFDFDFMVVVAATAIAKNHLLVLVVRVGVSVSVGVRLRSVVRWQDAGAGTIIWVSRQIRNPYPSSLSHLTLSLSGLSLLYFFGIFDKFEKG